MLVGDVRGASREGRESGKILAFTAPQVMQSSIVGLAQALTMFAGGGLGRFHVQTQPYGPSSDCQ